MATQSFVNSNYMTLTGGTFTGLINFSSGIPLNTTYAGCRLCLWLDSSPNNWYGFGMNGSTLIYNTSSNSQHSFQIGGTQNTYINSNGLTCNNTITCNNLTSNNNITCNSVNTNTATVTSFLYVSNGIGIGTNTPLFPLHISIYQSIYQTYKF